MSQLSAGPGRMGRYGLWQFRDYIADRGFSTLLIGFILGAQAILPRRMGLHDTFGEDWAIEPASRAILLSAVPELVITFAFLGTLIAVNGIVSNDRRHGYVRFLFAKPVSVSRYYLQAYAMSVAGLLLATAVLVGLFTVLVSPLIPLRALLFVGVIALGVGGIGFLLSTLVRGDWLFLSLVIGISALARGLYGERGGWREQLLVVLPPVHRVTGIYDSVLSGAPPAATDFIWVIGYGMLCLALGLVVLRRRPLVS